MPALDFLSFCPPQKKTEIVVVCRVPTFKILNFEIFFETMHFDIFSRMQMSKPVTFKME